MIQDVRLGTHKIGTNMYAISKCAISKLAFLEENCFKKWVWKGVWPQEGVAYDDSYCDKF